MKYTISCLLLIITLAVWGYWQRQQSNFNIDENLDYCVNQASTTLNSIPGNDSLMPRTVERGGKDWKFVSVYDWTSGFWPGTLWYLYEYTGDEKWKMAADKYSRELTPLSESPATDHDLGFQIYNSFGNGWRLTGNEAYKHTILRAADTLATLFNPKVGTILSWPRPVPNMEWPQHNTIIDNMLNLEMLFWASKNGGSKSLYDIAVRHAETTMKNQFRPDHTSYHVVIYDRESGEKIKAVTHQGFSDNSIWARGQSWAIYGFTMCYRETGKPEFLDFAEKVSDAYLERLPEDLIPYWDFNDTAIPDVPRDASAAAIAASGLLELATLVKDKTKARTYKAKAEGMLAALSTANYQSREANAAFLLHSTGHKPNGTEVDASIIYADYYYLEGLLRLKKLQEGKNIRPPLKTGF